MKKTIIASGKVVLRPIAISDAPRFVRWLNDPAVAKMLRGHKKKLTLKEERKWIRALPKKRKTEKQFAIMTTEGVHIGSTGLNLDIENSLARFGIVIGDKKYWGRGYGTDTTKAIMRYAFLTLKLHKIELNVYVFNKRAMRLYRKIGFKVEGIQKEHLRYGGKYFDRIKMGLLKRDYA